MERRRSRLTLACLSLAAAMSGGAAQPIPRELTTLLTTLELRQPIAGWCRGAFRAGGGAAFAVALAAGTSGGKYVVLESGAPVTDLAPFTGAGSLACYTRAEAQALDASIRESVTIHGGLTPRFQTTVVCAFTDDTMSVCWQYSPSDRAFVEIGHWIT